MSSITHTTMVMVLCASAMVYAQAPVRCAGPLSEAQIKDLIAGKVAEPRITQMITTCGVAFTVDRAAEARLKTGGATDAVVTAAREKFLATARAQIMQALRDHRWDDAEKQVGEFVKIVPNDKDLRDWRGAISSGRSSDQDEETWNAIKDGKSAYAFHEYKERFHGARFSEEADRLSRELRWQEYRPEIEQAIRDHRWGDAEAALSGLGYWAGGDREFAALRRTIREGREDDELAAKDGKAPARVEPQGRATVWFYRMNPLNVDTDRFSSQGNGEYIVSPIITLRGQRLVRLVKGRFFGIVLPPGEHDFHWEWSYIRVMVKDGEQVFVKMDHLPAETATIVDLAEAQKDFALLRPTQFQSLVDSPALGDPPGTIHFIEISHVVRNADIVVRKPFN